MNPTVGEFRPGQLTIGTRPRRRGGLVAVQPLRAVRPGSAKVHVAQWSHRLSADGRTADSQMHAGVHHRDGAG